MTDTSKALEAVSRIFNYCEEIDNNIPEEERTGYNMLDDIDIIRRTLKALENQKVGHWIELGCVGNDNYDFECSECHHTDTQSKTVKVNYCWYCGAKMEGE